MFTRNGHDWAPYRPQPTFGPNSPAKGHVTKREAKQSVRRVCTVGDVSVHAGEIVIEVSTSELRKSQARRAPYK